MSRTIEDVRRELELRWYDNPIITREQALALLAEHEAVEWNGTHSQEVREAHFAASKALGVGDE